MLKQKLKYALLASAFLLLSACSQSETPNKITFMLEWFVNPDHASLIVAKQKGFFAEQGLEVEFIEPADPNLPAKMISMGKVDYATHYQNLLQIQSIEAFNNVRIGTVIGQPLDSLMTIAGSNINKVSDLKGKKIGYTISGGISEAIIGTMLKHNGLSLEDVELVNINWQVAQSLATKQVAATLGAYRNFTVPELAQQGLVGKPFYPEDHGVPSFEELIIITHKDKAKSETSKKMLSAIIKAVAYIKANPEQAWQDFKAYKPATLDNKLNKEIWNLTYPLLTDRTAHLNKKMYMDNADFLYKNKLVKKALPALETYAINPLDAD